MAAAQDVYIRDTAYDPFTTARAVLAERCDDVLADLAAKLAMVDELNLSGSEGAQARTRLVEFCVDRIPRYLAAVERAVYAVAAGAADTRLLVRGLRAQHAVVAEHVAEVGRAATVRDAVVGARSVLAVLAACAQAERTALWPSLAASTGVDLVAVVTDFDAVLAGNTLDTPAELDVREIPHGSRHPRIFGVYARLAPGESFVLVNNHDPKPLRQEFTATYPGMFSWDYVESGPSTWRVRIGRVQR